MPSYLFTSDQRISKLPERIQWISSYVNSGGIISQISDKSENNNATTLASYYGLLPNTEVCAKAANDPIFAIRNFVLKFQFPNVRTSESLEACILEGTLLAPFRVVVTLLDKMANGYTNESLISIDEILWFVFCNEDVRTCPEIDYSKLITNILHCRNNNVDLKTLIERNICWNQYERQCRELFSVLPYASSCYKIRNQILYFSKASSSFDQDRDFIESIINYSFIWYPSDIKDFTKASEEYASYFDTMNTPYNVIEFHKKKHELSFDTDYPLQQIFYGAPGTGKSHTVNEITEKMPDENVFRITFHPDSDYSTFVGCYKPTTVKKKENVCGQTILDYDTLVDRYKELLAVPTSNVNQASTLMGYKYHDSIVQMQNNGHSIAQLVTDAYKSNTTYDTVVRNGMACFEENPPEVGRSNQITYEFVPQSFIKAYVKAMQTPDEAVMLVIEEINRGNCAQIFGDMFQLLDRNEDGVSDYAVKPDTDLEAYLKAELGDKYDEDEGMRLPKNLYIWATMNTSDQSLFPIDSAFKRRWEWKYMSIKDCSEGYKIVLGNGKEYDWYEFISKMNGLIADKTDSEDKQMGYFFIKAENGKITADRFVNKVLFYLYNDVFKSYDLPTEFGNKKFTAFFTDTDTKVEELMKDLGLKALAETDTAETTEDTAE